MSIQTKTVVLWDDSLRDIEFTDSSAMPMGLRGLAKYAIKITTGAPDASLHEGKFIPGAQIANAIDANIYENTGTVALPVWTVL